MLRNFELIWQNIDPAPLLYAADHAQDELWDEITLRQSYVGSAHHDTKTIFLRAPAVAYDLQNQLETVTMPWAQEHMFRTALDVVMEQFPLMVAELGRVMLVKLKPGGRIDRHADEGFYANHFSRFHVALASDPGNTFVCGDEAVHMKPGECWWFNHRVEHEVANLSAKPRIHLIFDARVSSLYKKEA